LKIDEFLSTLPHKVLSGEDVSLPDNVIIKILNFSELQRNEVFYHLGCGLNNAVRIAAKHYKTKKSVGIEIRKTLATKARKKLIGLKNCQIIHDDVRRATISDADVLFFWFTDSKIVQYMIKRFEKELDDGSRIITIWSPPDLMLPTKAEFPFFMCKKPFRYAENIGDQIKAIYGNTCIDFTAAWLLAEKYIKTLEVVPGQYHRFVNILQSMVIWINAWKSGVSCEKEIPPPVQAYVGILRTFFNIDLSDMISQDPRL
jgi:trans-aconitate methyltransferase